MVMEVLATKSRMKQDVIARTRESFSLIKSELKALTDELGPAIGERDPRLKVEYKDHGELSTQADIAGDSVIFTMHTNVFRLDQSNSLWKASYLSEDEQRGYFGIVNVYNFLKDSFALNRDRDIGYLVARLMLNKDGHFFVQGKRQLGFLYNDLADNVLDAAQVKAFLFSVVLYVLDFDLLTPPYDQVNQVTVEELKELNANSMITTGKRLGFQFQADLGEVT